MDFSFFRNAWHTGRLNRRDYFGYITLYVLIFYFFIPTAMPDAVNTTGGVITLLIIDYYINSMLCVQRLRDIGVRHAKLIGVTAAAGVDAFAIAGVIQPFFLEYLLTPLLLLRFLVMPIFFIIILFLPPDLVKSKNRA